MYLACSASFSSKSKAEMQPQWPQMTSISAQLSLSCHYSPFPPFCFIQQRPLNLILVEKIEADCCFVEWIYLFHPPIHTCSLFSCSCSSSRLSHYQLYWWNCQYWNPMFKKRRTSVLKHSLSWNPSLQKKLRQSKKNKESRYVRRSKREREREPPSFCRKWC